MLTEQHGQTLIHLVRQTLEEYLEIPPTYSVNPERLTDPALQENRAVFVTLNKRGQLRGCIGSLSATESIVDGVRRHAVNAAFHDHRFSPVTPDEIPELKVDISVLTEPQPLEYTNSDDLINKMRPQIDGILLKHSSGAGATFLPQVWEQLPNPQLFLTHLCRKAGLAENAWEKGDLEIKTYQVLHFIQNPRHS